MPSYRNVSIHVIGAQGQRFPERNIKVDDEYDEITVDLSISDDAVFGITITPDDWPIPELVHPNLASVEGTLPLTKRGPSFRQQPADWHLLATITFDGRDKRERRLIVPLDKRNPLPHTVEGEASATFRSTLTSEHVIQRRYWAFTSEGIDSFLPDDPDHEAVRDMIPIEFRNAKHARTGKLDKDFLSQLSFTEQENVSPGFGNGGRDEPIDHFIKVRLDRVRITRPLVDKNTEEVIDGLGGLEGDEDALDAVGAVQYELFKNENAFAVFYFNYDDETYIRGDDGRVIAFQDGRGVRQPGVSGPAAAHDNNNQQQNPAPTFTEEDRLEVEADLAKLDHDMDDSPGASATVGAVGSGAGQRLPPRNVPLGDREDDDGMDEGEDDEEMNENE